MPTTHMNTGIQLNILDKTYTIQHVQLGTLQVPVVHGLEGQYRLEFQSTPTDCTSLTGEKQGHQQHPNGRYQ
jgi:hypothetical protein